MYTYRLGGSQLDGDEEVHELVLHFDSPQRARYWHKELANAEEQHQFLTMGRQWNVSDPQTDKVGRHLWHAESDAED